MSDFEDDHDENDLSNIEVFPNTPPPLSEGQSSGGKSKLPNRRGHRPQTNEETGERTRLVEKQELYCKLRADGHNKTRAYRIAYPDDKTPGANSVHLEAREHVQKRIEELKQERAWAAKLVDPQESLVRWNEIYLKAMENGDIKVAIEAQKQIDKINGAEQAVVRQQLEVKTVFRGEQDEWDDATRKLFKVLQPHLLTTPTTGDKH